MLQSRNIFRATLAGFQETCPNCKKGMLYNNFLKVTDHCCVCSEALYHHRADDAPAYFTIFIVGHILVPLLVAIEISFQPPIWIHILVWGPLTVLMCYWLLPKIKGALIGIQWANHMHGFDPLNKD